jgi:hypothetical protein
MAEDLDDHRRIFDAAMIFKALPQFEDPFEQPGPAHHGDRI